MGDAKPGDLFHEVCGLRVHTWRFMGRDAEGCYRLEEVGGDGRWDIWNPDGITLYRSKIDALDEALGRLYRETREVEERLERLREKRVELVTEKRESSYMSEG